MKFGRCGRAGVVKIFITLAVSFAFPGAPHTAFGQSTEQENRESKAATRTLTRADSLYRVAREAMVAGDYNKSITLFDLISRRYPRSTHATSSLYYKAFLLYRQFEPGQPGPLKQALATLQQLERNYPNAPQSADGKALQNRICGELAQLGDSACRTRVVRGARPSLVLSHVDSTGDKSSEDGNDSSRVNGSAVIRIQIGPEVVAQRDTSCQTVKLDSYVSALNSLWKVDSTRAIAVAGQVLTSNDKCLVRLREQTLMMVTQRPTPVLAMSPIIFQLARNDPEPNIKRLATTWLLSQEWDKATAQFLHSVFGQPFKEKASTSKKSSNGDKVSNSDGTKARR